jgi:hypothetical protein
MLFTELIFCLFIVPFFQLFGILFQYRISLIYKYLWVMLFAISHLTNTFFIASYYDTNELSEGKSVIFIVLMMLNPYCFVLFNVILNYNSKFPKGKYFNVMPQYLLGYYGVLTLILLVLVILVD